MERNYPLDATLGDLFVAKGEEQRDLYREWCSRTGRICNVWMEGRGVHVMGTSTDDSAGARGSGS